MKFSSCLQAVCDFWRPNRYGLKEFVLQDGKRHPFAVICPGGGYGMVCSFLEGVPYAKCLNEQGYSAFVVYYRCKKKAHYPAPVADLARAVGDILHRAEELSLDTDNYSVWGSSAGGHLAALFGTQTVGYAQYGLPRPSALILSYPVITMGDLTHLGSRTNLLGKTPTDQEICDWSVENLVSAEYPPTYVWNSKTDMVVPPENSQMLVQRMNACGVPHQYHLFDTGNHGCGLGTGTECESWFIEAVTFWNEQMERREIK